MKLEEHICKNVIFNILATNSRKGTLFSSFAWVFRRFNPARFRKFGNWLEYSIETQVIYCLCCYLFKPDIGKQA